jgi:glycosyltransferase involved in cell wall biosynthesis
MNKKIRTNAGRIVKGAKILKNDGPKSLAIKSAQFTLRKLETSQKQVLDFNFLADKQDIIAADWATHPYRANNHKVKPPFTINWVMSPPDGVGGGHQNIFRFIQYIESKGHICRIYLYHPHGEVSVQEIKAIVKQHYPVKATIHKLDGSMLPADITFATGWETAYPVFNDKGDARKAYFVQDFEPYFYPVGSEYILAENTYKFGFFGVTAGNWLATKLSRDYGMRCAHYDFGVNRENYSYRNDGKRKEIFFYARPITTRRGFELGVMALDIVAKALPDYTITLAGWDVSNYNLPFKYKNLKALQVSELDEVYNNCAAALVMSLTNMSLLPLELLSAGVIPIVNDAENNRLVSDNPYIKYVQPSPDALAAAIIETVTREDLPAYAKKASDSVEGADWAKAGDIFEEALISELSNV